MKQFFHLFTHFWGDWEYYTRKNYFTLMGVIKCATFKERTCSYCGAAQHEFVDFGDKRPILGKRK